LDNQYYQIYTSHLSFVLSSIPNPLYNNLLPISLSNLQFIQTYNKPYFIYDKLTYKISIYADKLLYQNTLDGNPPSSPFYYLSCNRILFNRISGLDNFVWGSFSPGSEFQILFMDNLNNISSTGIIQNLQQESSIHYLSTFSGIRIVSNLPCQLEFDKTGTGQTILADFVPLEITANLFHSPLIYNAIVPYRQAQILSDTPFNNINMYVFYVVNTGQVNPLKLPPGLTASIKLMFQFRHSSKY
jgi:hypothetical protein